GALVRRGTKPDVAMTSMLARVVTEAGDAITSFIDASRAQLPPNDLELLRELPLELRDAGERRFLLGAFTLLAGGPEGGAFGIGGDANVVGVALRPHDPRGRGVA